MTDNGTDKGTETITENHANLLLAFTESSILNDRNDDDMLLVAPHSCVNILPETEKQAEAELSQAEIEVQSVELEGAEEDSMVARGKHGLSLSYDHKRIYRNETFDKPIRRTGNQLKFIGHLYTCTFNIKHGDLCFCQFNNKVAWICFEHLAVIIAAKYYRQSNFGGLERAARMD